MVNISGIGHEKQVLDSYVDIKSLVMMCDGDSCERKRALYEILRRRADKIRVRRKGKKIKLKDVLDE